MKAGYHGKKSDVVHVNSHERFSSEQLLGNIHCWYSFWRLNVSWIENTTHRNEFFFLALALHSSRLVFYPPRWAWQRTGTTPKKKDDMDGLFQINFLLPKKHIFTVTSFTCFMFSIGFYCVFCRHFGIHGWLDTGHRGAPKVLQQLLTIMAILGTVTFIVTLGLDF